MHAPVGVGYIQPNTTGIKFKNYVAGSSAVVSANLAEEAEPAVAFGAGGNANPTAAIVITGRVDSSGNVISGSGFTVNKTGTGTYVVTLNPALASAPDVQVAAITVGSSGEGATVDTVVSASQFTIYRYASGTGNPQAGAFMFTAQVYV